MPKRRCRCYRCLPRRSLGRRRVDLWRAPRCRRLMFGTRPAFVQRSRDFDAASSACPASSGRRLRARQMRDAIFLAIARDAELEIRIAQLRRTADGALVNRFCFTARLAFEPPASRCDLMTMAGVVNDLRPKEDQI